MPVVEHRALGNWLRAVFHSNKSGLDYEVQCHWEEGKWVAISCTCKGFNQHMKCYHLKETEDFLVEIKEPEPSKLENISLKLKYWYTCAICGGVDFMFKPLSAGFATPDEIHNSHPDGLMVVCCHCGRAYQL